MADTTQAAPAAAKLTPRTYLDKVLAGTALGVIVGLIPNAVLSAILKFFLPNPIAAQIIHVAVIFQLATPLIIGGLIALQFGFSPMQIMVVAGVAFVSSGVVKFNPHIVNSVTNKVGAYVGLGTGDLINTMLMSAVCVGALLLIKDKLGSTAVVTMPLLVGTGFAYIGVLVLPYVSQITRAIGLVINSFTTLQPVLMSILICCSFALIIISPVSTVAVGLAIQLNGISAAAAAMGVAATAVALVIHSWDTNKSGITLAIALGGMKMMMPNLFKYPIILAPCFFTAIISAVPIALFNVLGVPSSAGFGLVGLVGPLKSIELGLNIGLAALIWFVIPIAAGLLSRFLFTKVLHLYDTKKVFKYEG